MGVPVYQKVFRALKNAALSSWRCWRPNLEPDAQPAGPAHKTEEQDPNILKIAAQDILFPFQ